MKRNARSSGDLLGYVPTGCLQTISLVNIGTEDPLKKSSKSIGDLVGNTYRVVVTFWE
jgi:hypothetical protein